jgi:hypothetical protein
MERITPPLSAYYHHLKLYLDDLEEIESILKDARGLNFRSAGYKFDNLAELVTQCQDQLLRSILISSFDPYVQIDLDRAYNRLYCDTSDPTKGSGVFHRLDEVLKRASRKPRISYPRSYTRWSIVNSISVFAMLYLPITESADIFSWRITQYIPSFANYWRFLEWPWGFTGFLVIETVLFCSILGLLWSMSKRRVMIIISRRSQRRNFFVRNRDQLLVHLFVAVVAVILTLVASHFLESKPKP